MHELLGCELRVSLRVTALQEPELPGAMAFYCAVVKIQLGSALINSGKISADFSRARTWPIVKTSGIFYESKADKVMD